MSVALLCAGTPGCGNRFNEEIRNKPLVISECNNQDAWSPDATADPVQAELVVLDWWGGVTALYPDEDFKPLDLSAFPTSEGGTLADDPELFKEEVRLEVTRILCSSPGPVAVVRHAEDVELHPATRVVFTQDLSPAQGAVIGEGEYDVCNRQHDNEAVIFGEEIRMVGRISSFDEWVQVFANVTAHEIAHTFGFGHVDRATQWSVERSLVVELMLDGHTIDELRRQQTFVVEQSYCPHDSYRRRTNPPPDAVMSVRGRFVLRDYPLSPVAP